MSAAGILASSLIPDLLSQIGQAVSPILNGSATAAQSASGSNSPSAFQTLQQQLLAQASNTAGGLSSLSGGLTQLGQDLTSGNLSSAKSDFSSLESIFSSAFSSSPSQPSQPSSPATPANATAQSVAQMGSELQSNALAAAWQAYSAFQNPATSSLGSSLPANLSSFAGMF